MENKAFHNAEERVFRGVCQIQTDHRESNSVPRGNSHLTHKPIYLKTMFLSVSYPTLSGNPMLKKRCSRQDSHTCILWISSHFITLFFKLRYYDTRTGMTGMLRTIQSGEAGQAFARNVPLMQKGGVAVVVSENVQARCCQAHIA